MRLLLAKKILPITGRPLTNGAVCLKGGKILDVGPRGRLLSRYGGARVTELGDMLVMPGLVNAHTHLELSHLHGRISEHDGFFDWITQLIRLRRKIGTKGLAAAATKALKAAICSGTTCVGDISATELALPVIKKSGIRSVVYLEVIGLDDKEAVSSAKRLTERIAGLDGLPERIRAGISPHSTYSVSGKLYSLLNDISSDIMLNIAVHLSETKDESSHIAGRKSRIDGYLSMAGWDAHKTNRADSPLGFLTGKGFSDRLLAVHAVHVSSRDIRKMAKYGVSVAHCPRSNHLLGVGKAPVGRMLEAGVNVAIGTDSLASNLDMDIWEEMRFAYIVNRLSAGKVIEMGTINGARALGIEKLTGSLEPGKAADIIAVRGAAARAKDPYIPLLHETRPGDVALCMVDGKIIHKSDGVKI